MKPTKIYTRPLFTGVPVSRTYGTVNITGSDVFTYKASEFSKWGLNVRGRSKPAMLLTVSELIEPKDRKERGDQKYDGTYSDVWPSLYDDLTTLCVSQEQVEAFIKNHLEKLLLGKLSNLFLLTPGDQPVEEDRSNLFVADIHIGGNAVEAFLDRFADDFPLDAKCRHRFIHPEV